MQGIVIFIGTVLILYVGSSIFIPVLMAAFVWYLMNAIATYYRKIMPYKNTSAAGTVSMFLSLATFGGMVLLLITQISPMFGKLMHNLPEIQHKLQMMLDYLSGFFGFSVSQNMPDIAHVVRSIGVSAADLMATIGLIIVYIFFMFIEQSTFGKKLKNLFHEKKRLSKMRFILSSIDENMKKYLFMKTMISLVTAVLSYLWLWYLGVEFAVVWAFIVFITSYIPTFGAIVACSLPIIYSMLVADTLTVPLLVAGGLIVLQIIFGNIIEPRLTGRTLNLSTLAILINLMVWGMIWGPVGMFLSVPLLVATFVITAQFDNTRWIAVLLSSDGEIPNIAEED